MTKETLLEMGLTEEQAKKVLDSLNGNFIPKSRFNEVNTELKAAKDTIKERDEQLETLKKTVGDVEALKSKITELQTANESQKQAHETELRNMRKNNAVEMALTTAKAKNNIAVKALLADFLDKAEVADDGTVKGLNEAIKKLSEAEDTAFLFDTVTGAKFKGAKPAEKGDSLEIGMTLEKLRAMEPTERLNYSLQHPDEYKKLYENGGK